MRQQVQDIDGSIFEKLGAGDVLFVDSRRIRTPDSDGDVLLERVLPTLLQEGRQEILFSSASAGRQLLDTVDGSFVDRLSLVFGAIESSFWLCKR